MLKQAFFVCCVVLLSWILESDAHDTYAVSLGGAKVGLYNRRHGHGHGYGHGHRESESAASLGNAPVGLYHKHHHHHRSYRPVWKYPKVYGSPHARPGHGRPGYGRPGYGHHSYGPGVSGRRRCPWWAWWCRG